MQEPNRICESLTDILRSIDSHENPSMLLRRLANQFVLGLVALDDIPVIAESLISDNIESPSLLRLLADVNQRHEEHNRLFQRALAELGQVLPAKEDAAVELAALIASRIGDGSVTPIVGATFIWKEIVEKLTTSPPQLWAFKSNASAIEDCIADTKQFGSDHDDLIERCNREIVDAAELLARGLQSEPLI